MRRCAVLLKNEIVTHNNVMSNSRKHLKKIPVIFAVKFYLKFNEEKPSNNTATDTTTDLVKVEHVQNFCVCLFCKVVQKHCLGELGK